jgi:hypothetical protein
MAKRSGWWAEKERADSRFSEKNVVVGADSAGFTVVECDDGVEAVVSG